MEYLYADGEFYHFMMSDGSFEQHAADAKAVGDVSKWLKEQETYVITLFNGAPLAVTRLITSNWKLLRPIRASKVIQRKVARSLQHYQQAPL